MGEGGGLDWFFTTVSVTCVLDDTCCPAGGFWMITVPLAAPESGW